MYPKALFLYGTNKEDGSPNFGLFTWITGCWNGENSVMVCIGEPKLTKDRILEQKRFSANLVSEAMLPIADYFGNTSGHDPKKMDIPLNVGRGKVLDVPVLNDSPFVLELEVTQQYPLAEESIILVCKVCNTIKEKSTATREERIRATPPVVTIGNEYFTLQPVSKGRWGQWKNLKESK